jgi:hypothetical protein
MARHYSVRDFFRQMPNALLARYFTARELFNDLDFTAMKEGKPDELFSSWLELPDTKRNEMDSEFREIFEMSCEKGFRSVIICYRCITFAGRLASYARLYGLES